MRYCLEYHPNPNCLSIHLDEMVTTKMIELWDSIESPSYEDGERPAFVRDLFQIKGITRVSLKGYNVSLSKGSVFDWDEIINKALVALLNHFDPTGTIEETKPPIHHSPPTPEQIQRMENMGDYPKH